MTAVVTEPVRFEAVTPSGIEVMYEAAPKRHYMVRHRSSDEREFDVESEWREVPSVTTVLGVLDKPGLPWWSQGLAVESVIELVRRGLLSWLPGWTEEGYLAHPDGAAATKESIVALLTAEKLTCNHARDKAGARGQACHDAFETWAKSGQKPDPEMFPEEEKGYIAGLLAFLEDAQPEPLDCEVMVGSVEHGFAGRYDVRLRITEERRVVYKRTPVKGPQYAIVQPGIILGDLKTSKAVYTSHSRQLEAYEQASVECGYEPTVARGIIHVNADGGYEFVRSTATFHDFKVVLAVWQSDEDMKARKR